MALDALLALFALAMLVRNGPGALLAVRGERRAAHLTAAVNVVLAVAILTWAVKGLAARLISR
jgi:hypothetical protein